MEKGEKIRLLVGLIILSILMILYILSGATPIDTTTPKIRIERIDNVECTTDEFGEVECREE